MLAALRDKAATRGHAARPGPDRRDMIADAGARVQLPRLPPELVADALPGRDLLERQRRRRARHPGPHTAAARRPAQRRLRRAPRRLVRRRRVQRRRRRHARSARPRPDRRRPSAPCTPASPPHVPGARLGDIGHAIAGVARRGRLRACSPTTAATGSGGRCTRRRSCRTRAGAGSGMKLRPGLVIAIEPMLLARRPRRLPPRRRRLDAAHRRRQPRRPRRAHHRRDRRRPEDPHRSL